jgi:restriction endonuclease Mrr
MIEKLKPGFRDVRDKLKQYQEFRTDDAIKDLMIASSAQFEAIARSMLEGMGMHISSLRLVGDAAVEALTSESETNKRMMRKAYTLILIQREMNALAERHVREFHESMREKNASRGIIMTTGEVTPQALSFASSRPIEIYDSAKLADALKGVSVN